MGIQLIAEEQSQNCSIVDRRYNSTLQACPQKTRYALEAELVFFTRFYFWVIENYWTWVKTCLFFQVVCNCLTKIIKFI